MENDDDSHRIDASEDLGMVFNLDPSAWSPRKLVYAEAVEAAESTGSQTPSPTEVYLALRARGFREAKRRGVWGFVGIRTVGDAAQPRIKPSGTESAYLHRGDRSERARSARYTGRLVRAFDRKNPPMPADQPHLSPWFQPALTPEERSEIVARRNKFRPRSKDLRDQMDHMYDRMPSIDD